MPRLRSAPDESFDHSMLYAALSNELVSLSTKVIDLVLPPGSNSPAEVTTLTTFMS